MSATPTPSAAPTAGGYPAAPSAWARDPAWRALGFVISGPHRYQYRVEATDPGRGYTATAIGDLDGDGIFSTFSHHPQFIDGEIQRPVTQIVNQFE
ncbi:MAG: hypothetical protein Q8S73_17415 [Deltaproteobacteria bacterium]|nr:hypothetical protein [Deltaproteobacteria bacterium]